MKRPRFIPSLAEGIADWLDFRPRKSLAIRANEFEAAERARSSSGYLPEDWPRRAALLFGVQEERLSYWDAPAPQIVAECRQLQRVRRAKLAAKTIGLVYWPALLEPHNCSSAAFVAAEQTLIRQHGEWICGSEDQRGGWDACAHYGVSPQQVAAFWFAAGCRDSAKFRWQVANQQLAKKGDSLPWLRNYLRGLRWVSDWGFSIIPSRNAVAALGRLSPELRHAAMRGVTDRAWTLGVDGIYQFHPIRVRHLNWAEVARIQALRQHDSLRAQAVRASVLPNRPAWAVLGQKSERGCDHPIQDQDVPVLCPDFPLVAKTIAARLAAGEPPVKIAGGELSRQEAHQWLREGGRQAPLVWLIRELPLHGFIPRDIAVARWLLHVWRRGAWSALTAVVRHPDGRQMHRLDVIDEIQPVDLDRGPATGVERAFDRAAERLAKVDAADTRTISHWPVAWPRLPRCASLLTSPAALAAEGKMMRHCVGGYADAVAAQQCWIVSIVSRHGRSTVELRADGQVAQHYGVENSPPHPRHVALMRAWQTRLNNSRSRKAA